MLRGCCGLSDKLSHKSEQSGRSRGRIQNNSRQNRWWCCMVGIHLIPIPGHSIGSQDSTMDYFWLLKALDWSRKDSFIAKRPLKHLFEFLVHLKAAFEGCNQCNKNGSDNKALVLPEHIKTSTDYSSSGSTAINCNHVDGLMVQC